MGSIRSFGHFDVGNICTDISSDKHNSLDFLEPEMSHVDYYVVVCHTGHFLSKGGFYSVIRSF